MGKRWGLILLVAGIGVAAAAAVAIVGLALGGGGGGSSSREDYQAAVVNARDRVDFALERITKSQSVDELIERIDEAAQAVGDTASDLDHAGAAEGFEDENEKLVEVLRAFSDELAATADTFRDPSFAETLSSINSLGFKQWDEVNRVLADLKEQGIDVEPLERH